MNGIGDPSPLVVEVKQAEGYDNSIERNS